MGLGSLALSLSHCGCGAFEGFGGFSTLKRKRRPMDGSRGMEGDAFTGPTSILPTVDRCLRPGIVTGGYFVVGGQLAGVKVY